LYSLRAYKIVTLTLSVVYVIAIDIMYLLVVIDIVCILIFSLLLW